MGQKRILSELYNRIDLSNLPGGILPIKVIDAREADGVLIDLDTLADILRDANTVEVTTAPYMRVTLDAINLEDIPGLNP